MKFDMLRNKFSLTSRATIIFGICNILQKAIPFLLMPVLTRYLTTEEYGIYSLYNSWVVIVTVFATLNMHLGSFNNGLCKYEGKRLEYTVSIISLCNVVTVITLFLFVLLQYGLHIKIIDLPIKYIILLFVSVFGTQGYNCWVSKSRYEYYFFGLLKVIVITSVFSAILPITAVFFKANLFLIILGTQIPCICAGVICFISCFCKNHFYIERTFWKEELSFSLPLLPHYISGVILNQMDRVMIQQICGETEVAYYSVAYNLSSAFNLVINSANAAMVPEVYRAITDNNYKKISQQIEQYSDLWGIGILSLMLVMPEILALIASSNYSDALMTIPPIVLCSYFMFIYTIMANIEFYYKSKWFISFSSVIAAVINVALNAIFIPKYGYYAAAYTTAISYFIYSCMHMCNVYRLEKEKGFVGLISFGTFIYRMFGLCFATFVISKLYLCNGIVRYLLLVMFIIAFMIRKYVKKER